VFSFAAGLGLERLLTNLADCLILIPSRYFSSNSMESAAAEQAQDMFKQKAEMQ
jgi:hypothetical protein